MSNKFEVKYVERGDIETIGEVMKNRMFLPLVFLMIISISLLLVMSIGNYWPSISLRLDGALFGIVGGLYTMAIGTVTLTISWLLVDDCSWFFKCIMLFCSALLFIACGIHYFVNLFRDTHRVEKHVNLTDDWDWLLPGSNSSLALFPELNVSFSLPQFYSQDRIVLDDSNFSYLRTLHLMYICYEGVQLEDTSVWTPILIVICIFLGVLYLMFSVYICLSLDEA